MVVVGAGVWGVTDVVLGAVEDGVGEALVPVGVTLGVFVGVCSVGLAVDSGVAVCGGVVVDGGVVVEVVVVVVVGGAVVLLLATVRFPRRLDVVPSDQVSTALIVCDPSVRFVVSYGSAVPSAAVPAKSKGGTSSVRTGDFVGHWPSR
jgi:hypothetical protein